MWEIPHIMEQVLQISDGFTGADLESTLRNLAYKDLANEHFVLSDESIAEAFRAVIPLLQTMPEKIEDIRNWGKCRAVPASGKSIKSDEDLIKPGIKIRKMIV